MIAPERVDRPWPRTPVRHGSLDHAPKRPASRPLPTSPKTHPSRLLERARHVDPGHPHRHRIAIPRDRRWSDFQLAERRRERCHQIERSHSQVGRGVGFDISVGTMKVAACTGFGEPIPLPVSVNLPPEKLDRASLPAASRIRSG